MRTLIRIAVRNLLRHARHSAFALVAIVFGVAGLALADGFIRDVFFQLGEATVHAQLGHLQITKPGFREGVEGRPEALLIKGPGAIRSALRKDPRIQAVAGRLHLSGLLTAGSRELPVEVDGVEPGLESQFGVYLQLLDGADLVSGGPHSALLGEGVARQLGVRAGSFVNLTAATADGSLNVGEFRVAGVFRSFSKDFDDRAVRISLAEAQNLVQAPGVHELVIHLKRTDATDEVLSSVRGRFDLKGLDVQPWYLLSDFYANTRALYARQFGILQMIALVLIAMSVLTSFNITVFERTAEFGTMRALGAHSRTVAVLLVLEGTALGVLGAAIGLVVAGALGAAISWHGIPMPPPPNAEAGFIARILLSSGGLLLAAAVGVTSAVLGSLLPAMRIKRQTIVSAVEQRL